MIKIKESKPPKNRYLKIFILILIVVFLSLIAALRGDTYDTEVYRDFFENLGETFDPSQSYDNYFISNLFGWVTFGVKKITNNFRVYLFIITFVSLLLYAYSVGVINDNDYAQTFLIFATGYFPLLFLIQMRQGLATTFAYLATALLVTKQKYRLAIVFAAISVLLHEMFYLYWLVVSCVLVQKRFKLKPIYALFPVVVASLALYYGSNFYSIVNMSKMNYYLEHKEYSAEAVLISIVNIKLGVICVIGTVIYRSLSDSHKQIVLILISALILRIGLQKNSTFSGRGTSSMIVLETMIIPKIARYFLNPTFALITVIGYSIIQVVYLLFIQHTHILELY